MVLILGSFIKILLLTFFKLHFEYGYAHSLKTRLVLKQRIFHSLIFHTRNTGQWVTRSFDLFHGRGHISGHRFEGYGLVLVTSHVAKTAAHATNGFKSPSLGFGIHSPGPHGAGPGAFAAIGAFVGIHLRHEMGRGHIPRRIEFADGPHHHATTSATETARIGSGNFKTHGSTHQTTGFGFGFYFPGIFESYPAHMSGFAFP